MKLIEPHQPKDGLFRRMSWLSMFGLCLLFNLWGEVLKTHVMQEFYENHPFMFHIVMFGSLSGSIILLHGFFDALYLWLKRRRGVDFSDFKAELKHVSDAAQAATVSTDQLTKALLTARKPCPNCGESMAFGNELCAGCRPPENL